MSAPSPLSGSPAGGLSRRTLLAASLAIPHAASAWRSPIAPADVVVDTSAGRIRGRSESGIHVFRGIPYAASTAGRNRFLPPQPITPWAGIRDALDFGHSAPQPPGGRRPLMLWYETLRTVGEDCLVLNVFTPQASHGARRPVMVWLHGGGWVEGSGTAPGFEAHTLARLGDVVVFTINHRLNHFGYLLLDDADERFADAGNAGVLDMVAALRWIRDNAAAFGGDPSNVTIFGQSGGGAKVCALMDAPAAAGLFHRAIAQSCSGSLQLLEANDAAALCFALGQRLGLSKVTGEALQAIDMQRLIEAGRGIFFPVRDGRSFSRHPFDPSAPPFAADVSFMTGNAATETNLGLAADPGNFLLDGNVVKARLQRFLKTDAAATDRIIEAFRSADPTASPSEILANVTTGYQYIRNTRRAALLQSASGRRPTFVYQFDWRTNVLNGALKSPHAIEVPFIFGSMDRARNYIGTGPGIAPMSRIMISTWSAFAHGGDPNNATVPHWPAFDPSKRQVMRLDVESRMETDPGGIARASLEDLPYFKYGMLVNFSQA